MATKHYCDVCGKEKDLRDLGKLTIEAAPNVNKLIYADVCSDCTYKPLIGFKQFKATILLLVEFPEKEKAKAVEKKRRNNG